MGMPATQTISVERYANIAKVAAQAAETALCHYAHVNGVTFSDHQFASDKDVLAGAIRSQLLEVEHRGF